MIDQIVIYTRGVMNIYRSSSPNGTQATPALPPEQPTSTSELEATLAELTQPHSVQQMPFIQETPALQPRYYAQQESWQQPLVEETVRSRLQGQLREMKYELHYLRQQSHEIAQRTALLVGAMQQIQELLAHDSEKNPQDN